MVVVDVLGGLEVPGSSTDTEEAVEVVEAEAVLEMTALVVVVVDATVTIGSDVSSVLGAAGSDVSCHESRVIAHQRIPADGVSSVHRSQKYS